MCCWSARASVPREAARRSACTSSKAASGCRSSPAATTAGASSRSRAGASGGYLIGFVAAAVVVGSLAERGWDRTLRSSIGAMLIGEVLVYGAGLPWLAASLHVSATKAYEYGLYPFIIGDLIKLAIAAGLLPSAWKLVKR
ncbi:MAG: biotin transporter BioY [Actinomycetota bacterium]